MRADQRSAENTENEDEDPNANNRNCGSRARGPWVFGSCWRHDNILERRFFTVQKIDAETLLPVIIREVKPGSTIHRDECRAYSNLNRYGFIHKTANHNENLNTNWSPYPKH